MITPPIRPFPVAKTMSLDVGILHFVGIGGIGMSGIAELLHNLGYQVQGSDIAENPNVARLRGLGIKVHIGHDARNLEDAAVLVKSTAVKEDNPEIMEARKRHVPVVRRSEMLAELMRLKMTISVAGTHGKTTTTSMIAALFEAAKRRPTVINGGIINAYGTNAVLGEGEWMIVEADESDGTFIRIPSTVAVVTNIDPEHLDHYGSFDALRGAFKQFLDNLPFYGFGVLCLDHPEVQALIARVTDRRILTYGLNPQARVRAVNVVQEESGQRFDVEITPKPGEAPERIENVWLPMHGEHNLRNALAAIAVCQELHFGEDAIKAGFAGFTGVKRRFTKTGEVDGVSIIDDYGHHPVEIAATLSSARMAADRKGGRVIAVVQPHRYSRLESLFEEFCGCFNDADIVVVAEVYSAGEDPIQGVDRDALCEGLRARGHQQVEPLASEAELPGLIRRLARPKDYVVCLGAGSISKWANALPAQLDALEDRNHEVTKQEAS